VRVSSGKLQEIAWWDKRKIGELWKKIGLIRYHIHRISALRWAVSKIDERSILAKKTKLKILGDVCRLVYQCINERNIENNKRYKRSIFIWQFCTYSNKIKILEVTYIKIYVIVKRNKYLIVNIFNQINDIFHLLLYFNYWKIALEKSLFPRISSQGVLLSRKIFVFPHIFHCASRARKSQLNRTSIHTTLNEWGTARMLREV